MKLKDLMAVPAEEMLEAAMSIILRKRPYIAYFFLPLKKKAIKGGTAAVMADEKTGDITFLFNPEFFRLLHPVPGATATIITHEMLHLALLHPFTKVCDDHTIANKVYDAVVNELILKKTLRVNSSILLQCPLCASDKKTSLEEYWRVFKETTVAKHLAGCPMCLAGDLSVHPKDIPHELRPWRMEDIVAGDYSNLVGYFKSLPAVSASSYDHVVASLANKYSPEEAQLIIDALLTPPEYPDGMGKLEECANAEELKSKLQATSVKAAGDGSAGDLADLFRALSKDPEVPWNKYLTSRICASMSVLTEPSRLVRNRRFGFQFPGVKRSQSVKIVLGMDTSGSMHDELLLAIKNNIMSLRGLGTVDCTVVEFDMEYQREYDIEKLDSVVKGRGGTDLTVPLQYMLDTKQPAGTILFVFTDGYGPITIPEVSLREYVIHWMLPEDGSDHEILRFGHPRSYVRKFKFDKK